MERFQPTKKIDDLQANIGSCNGRAAGLGFAIKAPIDPQPYDLPLDPDVDCIDADIINLGDQSNCVIVHNATQLQQQAGISSGGNSPKDIILEDGEYFAEKLISFPTFPEQKFLKFSAGHRLWAKNLGGAILHFGIDTGSPNNLANEERFAGPEFHGLVFDIRDEKHGALNVSNKAAPPTIAISIWGVTKNAVIEDVEIYGHDVINQGIQAIQGKAADGLEIRRVIVDGFNKMGIWTAYCDHSVGGKNAPRQCESIEGFGVDTVIEDVVVQNIGGSFNPADLSENRNIGILMGAPGRLSRAYVRNVTRVGIATNGSMWGGILEDLDVDNIGVGTHGPLHGRALYMDNTTIDTEFNRFCIGSHTQIGLISEWDNCNSTNPPTGCFIRSIDNTVKNGLIESWDIGINFDQGTTRGHIENVTFRNAGRVGIVMHNNVDSVQINNTFELPRGSCPFTTKVWNAPNLCERLTIPPVLTH